MQVRASTKKRLEDDFTLYRGGLLSQDEMINKLLDESLTLAQRIGIKFEELAFISKEALSSDDAKVYSIMNALIVQYFTTPHKRGVIRNELEAILRDR
jgi:hypothetical protein